MSRIKAIVILLFLPVLTLMAQGLPKLKMAEEITTGSFSNGIEYYFVKNPVVAKRADIALVQFGDFSVEESRRSFYELEHINAVDFLKEQGLNYTEDGFISYYDGARVFRFQDINLKDKATSDSTLLMLMDFMQLSYDAQTLVMCGDIDKDKWIEKINTLSLVLPKVHTQKYESSIPKEASVFKNNVHKGKVSLSFQLATVNAEQAGTAIPLMSEYLYLQFLYILQDRLTLAFKAEDIPLYIDLTRGGIDINFPVEQEYIANTIINDALTDLACGGATIEELTYAKKIALPDIVESGLKQGKANSIYTDKCINSILTGSNLASEETIRKFFSNRKISPKRELELFDNYASALLANQYDGQVEFKYKRQSYPDLNAALKINPKGVKLANSAVEPMTGGKFWMFNNGIKVIYKHVPNANGFNFCLAQRGGASSMSNLKSGESAFLSDMFFLNRFAGIEGKEFKQVLRTRGIDIRSNVTLEDTMLSGVAPSDELETVLKTLVKLMYSRQYDQKAFDYYKRCERLRTDSGTPNVRSVMDSLMCPTYAYPLKSSGYNIREDLLIRANSFFDERFSNVSDGVFIIMGNIPEAKTLDLLSKYLGSFETSGSYAIRTRVPYDFYSGRTTHIEQGEESSVSMAATTLLQVNIDNYLMFLLAKEAISRQFAKSLYQVGMYAEVGGVANIAPVEGFTFYITLRFCAQDGLPEGVEVPDPTEAIKVVREEFARMQYMVISKEEFDSYKEIVKSNMVNSLSAPKGMMEYALFRYSNCRDLTHMYQSRLDKIVVDDIRWILEEIISAGVVEYIVK